MGTGVARSVCAPGKNLQECGRHASDRNRVRWTRFSSRLLRCPAPAIGRGRAAKKCSQVDRPISTRELNALLRLHFGPINLVICQEPDGETSSWSRLRAYMLSALIQSVLSYPALPLARQLEHQGYVRPNPLVLGTNLRTFPSPAPDRDRPVSRRSEPSSRTAFIGEQPNPWDLLQPQDAMSRHRGAKPPRRYGLLGEISLLSPEYLLSDERRPFHMETAGSLSPAFTPA